MQIGPVGLQLIEEFEGCVLTAYWDPYGKVWTIGYGTTSGAGVGKITEGMTITKQTAVTWLEETVNREIIPVIEMAQASRKQHTHHDLNENQIDALCSLAYNCGAGVLEPGHTIGDDLTHGAPAGKVAQDFMLYDKSGGEVLPGLVRRREAERQLFLRPIGAPNP